MARSTLDPQLLGAILALHDQGASAARIAELLNLGRVPAERGGAWDERAPPLAALPNRAEEPLAMLARCSHGPADSPRR